MRPYNTSALLALRRVVSFRRFAPHSPSSFALRRVCLISALCKIGGRLFLCHSASAKLSLNARFSAFRYLLRFRKKMISQKLVYPPRKSLARFFQYHFFSIASQVVAAVADKDSCSFFSGK